MIIGPLIRTGFQIFFKSKECIHSIHPRGANSCFEELTPTGKGGKNSEVVSSDCIPITLIYRALDKREYLVITRDNFC